MTKKKQINNKIIVAENGQVVIRNSLPVGTEWLPPEQARELGRTLITLAAEADKQATRMAN